MEEVERFTAEGTSGRRYTVIVWAQMVPFTPASGVTQWLRGGTEMRLVEGSHVNPKEPGVFQIFDTEEIIRKIED